MSTLRTLQFKLEDYPGLVDAEPKFSDFLTMTNQQNKTLEGIVNNGLLLKDNFAAKIKQVTVTTKSPWVAPQLLNSWANYGSGFAPAGYYRDARGTVWLQGVVKSGSGYVMQLPAGYRPVASLQFPAISNAVFGWVQIDATGNVGMGAGSNVSLSLSGVSFLAGDTSAGASPNPVFPVTVAHGLAAGLRPVGVFVLSAMDVTAGGNTGPAASSTVSFTANSTNVVISDMPGLLVNLLILGG